jgi:hypothetical protein
MSDDLDAQIVAAEHSLATAESHAVRRDARRTLDRLNARKLLRLTAERDLASRRRAFGVDDPVFDGSRRTAP